MGAKLFSLFTAHDPLVTPGKLLRLDFQCEESMEMPLVWIASQLLLYMWGVRCNGKIVDVTLTRATLESKISLLRETRFVNEYTIAKEILENIM